MSRPDDNYKPTDPKSSMSHKHKNHEETHTKAHGKLLKTSPSWRTLAAARGQTDALCIEKQT